MGESAPAVRYLIVTSASEVEAAAQVWGKAYKVISREQALNGHAAEIAECPIVLWPDPDTVDRERQFGRQLRQFSADVKLIRTDLPQNILHSVMLTMQWGWKEAIDYLAEDNRARIEVLLPAEIVDIPETSVKLRVRRDKLDKLAKLAINATINGGSPDAPDESGSPLDTLGAQGEPPPYEEIPAEAYSEAQGPLTADEATPYRSVEDASGGPEWGVPIDFWGTEGLPSLQLDQMPEFGPYVLDQASRNGLDAPQIALNCWCVCAALLRRGIELAMQSATAEGRQWREQPILWGAAVGDSGSGKGPGLSIATDRFLRIASDLRKQEDEAWKAYENEYKIHEKRLQSYYSEAAKNPGAVQPEAPERPARTRLWTDDVTKEKIGQLLNDNPRGKILILKDELAGWAGSMGAYGNTGAEKDRSDWLSFYESRERWIDRVGDGKSIHVDSWGGLILGGIQSDILAKLVTKGTIGTTDGMLQRFMLIVNRPKTRPAKRAEDSKSVANWNRLCDNLAAMEPRGNPVTLSAAAAEFVDAKSEWISNAMDSGISQGMKSALSKFEGLIGRLAITAHCVSDASRGLRVPSPEVSLDTVEICWRWMHGILWPHMLHFYGGAMGAGPIDKLVTEFAQFVLARDIEELKPHWLASNWSTYRRDLKTMQARKEFWDAVCMTGWARGSGVLGRSGSIYDKYIIHPDVHTIFKRQKAIAKLQAQKYREIAHPAFIAAQQGREPGED